MLYVIAGLLLACLLALLVLACRSCASSDSPKPDGQDSSASGTDSGTDTSSATIGVPDNVILPATADAGLAYQDRLTFVGDSLTAHIASRGVLTGGTNTTQVWRTQTNMLNLDSQITHAKIGIPGTGRFVTIAEAAGELKPGILIITLGTDYGVSFCTETEFKSYYTSLVQAIKQASPTTIILLQSIFPVTKDCTRLTNQKIDIANTWVKAVAAENGCRYLDTQSVLKDRNNCLKAEYCIDTDGIHLTAEAYKVILTYIRTHAVV